MKLVLLYNLDTFQFSSVRIRLLTSKDKELISDNLLLSKTDANDYDFAICKEL